MGSNNGDTDEAPVRQVTVSNFRIAAHVVTQAEWYGVARTLPRLIRVRDPRLPVTEISWYEAISFCNRLSELEGRPACYAAAERNVTCDFGVDGYRLPTEAEWEFACRGGRHAPGNRYSGSDDLNAVAWYVGNSDQQLHPVCEKDPNELGLFDMSGNVYEYCWDVYGPYSPDAETDPPGPTPNARNPHRVIRGGNCYGLPYRQRCAARWKYKYMGYRHDFLGLRAVTSNAAES